MSVGQPSLDEGLENLKQKTAAFTPSAEGGRLPIQQKKEKKTPYGLTDTTTDWSVERGKPGKYTSVPTEGSEFPAPMITDEQKAKSADEGISLSNVDQHSTGVISKQPKAKGMHRLPDFALMRNEESFGLRHTHSVGGEGGDIPLRMSRMSLMSAPSTLICARGKEKGFQEYEEIIAQSGHELKGAMQPLESLRQEFIMEYQTALYEQKHGPRTSREAGQNASELVEAVAMASHDPLVSEHRLSGDKHSRLEIPLPSKHQPELKGAEALSPKRELSAASLKYEGLPELVEGVDALSRLHSSELIQQCLLRDQLNMLSELHEKELGELLNEAEANVQSLTDENRQLKIENRKQKEEIKLLTVKLKAMNLEPSRQQSGGELSDGEMLHNYSMEIQIHHSNERDTISNAIGNVHQ
jgi:hypothetical protein